MNDSWNREELSYIRDLLDDLQRVSYEIDNCYRGAYTNCNTYQELGEYIGSLANKLAAATEDLSYIDEDE